MMNWFNKLIPSRPHQDDGKGKVPEGIWAKCDHCENTLYQAELERNRHVCPKCTHHMYVPARQRLMHFLDPEPQIEIGADLSSVDILKFKDTKRYRDRLVSSSKATEEKDALVAMRGTVGGLPLTAVACEFRFMGGSMGSVVGERLCRAIDTCIEHDIPLVAFTASGGARMQEGLFSLMQMAKTSAALARLAERRLPYVCVLTHPTMGGVSASFAMLGDILLAEPKAMIGFAGRRVIEQTVREKLPDNFQLAEFLFEHGGLDMIVDRRNHRRYIGTLLSTLTRRAVSFD